VLRASTSSTGVASALALLGGAHLCARSRVLLGHLFPAETHPSAYETFRFLSKAFINLIKMLIVPLIFSTIVVGIGKTGDVKAVGRMGIKALIYFEIATTAALVLGLSIAHWVRPGDGLTLPPRRTVAGQALVEHSYICSLPT
jgi:Na+/H+-dicarboxylate symporter